MNKGYIKTCGLVFVILIRYGGEESNLQLNIDPSLRSG